MNDDTDLASSFKFDDSYFDSIFEEADKNASTSGEPLTESPFQNEDAPSDVEFVEDTDADMVPDALNTDQETEHYDEAPKRKRLSQSERYKKQLQETRAQLDQAYALANQAQLEKQHALEALWTKESQNLETEAKYWNVINEDYKFALKHALDAGDSERIAELTQKMNSSDNMLRDLSNKQNNLAQSYNQYKAQAQQNSYAAPQQHSYNPDAENFLARNPFLDPSKNNPNYSPEAVSRVSKISADLSMAYKMEGRGDEINTQSYFNDLENQMNREFNRKAQPQSQQRSSSPRSPRMVAPVGKRQTMQNDTPKMNLSQEHKTLMMALRNEFGTEHDGLLKKAFAGSVKGYQPKNEHEGSFFE